MHISNSTLAFMNSQEMEEYDKNALSVLLDEYGIEGVVGMLVDLAGERAHIAKDEDYACRWLYVRRTLEKTCGLLQSVFPF